MIFKQLFRRVAAALPGMESSPEKEKTFMDEVVLDRKDNAEPTQSAESMCGC